MDLIKGYARASVIAFVVMVAAEIDLDTDYDKVKPFEAFLDRAFLLPSNVSGHYLEYHEKKLLVDTAHFTFLDGV